MNTAVAVKPNPIQVHVENVLAPIRGEMNSLNSDVALLNRIQLTFAAAVGEKPEILKCEVGSLRRAILKCCSDGLVPDSKEAVILPYNEKNKDGSYSLIANYQPMVYGIIKRMRDLGEVFNIVVNLVHERDTFHINLADPEDTKHEFKAFGAERGEIVGSYCIIRDDQKRVLHREIVSLAELEVIRSKSKAPNSPAWKEFKAEMYKKATLRRGSKYVPLKNPWLRELVESIDQMFDFSAKREPDRANPFTGEIADKSAAGSPEKAKTTPEPENQKTEEWEKPLLAIGDLQAYSNWLWKSKRTQADLKVDAQQHKTEHWKGKVAGPLLRTLNVIDDVHWARVGAKDAAAADDAARMNLAEIGIESPEAP